MRPPSVEWHDGTRLPSTLNTAKLQGLALESEGMDARIFCRDSQGRITAWASLWWKNTPYLENNRVAAIGGFGATDEESAHLLLDCASSGLLSLGFHRAVGPMNGNTWRSYRFVVESNGRNPFFMEPRNPPEYPAWWKSAGFEELAGYSSSLVPLDGRSTAPCSLVSRLTSSGVTIRDIDPLRFEEELEAIHCVTLSGFSRNFLYTPLSKGAFIAAYLKIKDHVAPDFVRIAERDGSPCGYVFAIPDLEAASREPPPALVIKTLTVAPSARCPGLGSLLVDEVQRRGYDAGFRHAIHALQYDENTVLRITARHGGQQFRRYALFSKSL